MALTQVASGDIVFHFGPNEKCSVYFVRVASRYPDDSAKRICEALQTFCRDGVRVWFEVEKPSRFGPVSAGL